MGIIKTTFGQELEVPILKALLDNNIREGDLTDWSFNQHKDLIQLTCIVNGDFIIGKVLLQTDDSNTFGILIDKTYKFV
jgi:hypothetical protein